MFTDASDACFPQEVELRYGGAVVMLGTSLASEDFCFISLFCSKLH